VNKKYIYFITILLFFPLCLFAQEFWPEGKKATIVLTYDDGLNSQLENVIPQLDSKGFKGTFFLYGHVSEEMFGSWKKVSETGHEIGNHSLFHPCRGESPQSKRFSSESYDIPSIIREIQMMNKMIYAICGKKPVSYAYPCGENAVGGTDYSDSLRRSGFIRFARLGQTPGVITDFKNLDLMKVPAFAPAPGSDSAPMIEFVKKVMEKHGLGVLVFHGISGDYLTISAEQHRKLLEYLDSQRDKIWIAPFGEVMEYVSGKR
jgi:peptidoglycan-N-acetylglucosamine deacetylase